MFAQPLEESGGDERPKSRMEVEEIGDFMLKRV